MASFSFRKGNWFIEEIMQTDEAIITCESLTLDCKDESLIKPITKPKWKS